ncbi:MAG: sn-glycerol-3-phosphate ABC transporter ATP-binding protein UgpC [Rhizobiaceae bacterium]
MAEIVLSNVGKVYPNGQSAVTDLNLTIRDKEFLVLVGPSGCGKSTILRMIAGLEDISSGTLTIGGRVANDLEPKDRDLAMVFQSYALYPHMTVAENIGFPLRLAKVDKGEIDRAVREAARILELGPYLDRRPAQLSGGQRQRVAMGRAIVRKTSVYLLDEPLSNLDAKLRDQTRSEMVDLQMRLGVTTVYVTHDQVEAMTMGHRVAVMKDGFLQQVAEPKVLYNKPVNAFVAAFIGTPAMNFLDAEFVDDQLVVAGKPVTVTDQARANLRTHTGTSLTLGVRPEHLALSDSGIGAEVSGVEWLGSDAIVRVRYSDRGAQKTLVLRCDGETGVKRGDIVHVHLGRGIHVFDEAGRRIEDGT